MDDLFILQSARSVSPEAVNNLIDETWKELQASAGPSGPLAAMENPFRARRDQAQFDVATTIAIAVMSGLAKDVATSLWKDSIWPALRAKFGSDIKVQDEPPG